MTFACCVLLLSRVKCVIRFAYTNTQGGTTDPLKSILLNHISQLTPILTSNQDAILAVQAGFVGPWGEWHGSTNFGDDLEGRQAIVNALLEAVPERNVQIRTPLHKQTLYASDSEPTIFSEGHVANGDFEGSNLGSSWGSYMSGYEIDTADSNNGLQSVKVTNGAAKQWVSLNNVEEGYVIEISGFSKLVGATGSAPWDYSIYVDVAYGDGSYLWGQMAKFTVRSSLFYVYVFTTKMNRLFPTLLTKIIVSIPFFSYRETILGTKQSTIFPSLPE